MRLHNFSAGPAALPESVLAEVQSEFLEFRDTGASIVEISHRSPQYTEVAEAARVAMRQLLGVGKEWHILFLQGGASLQFYQVPLNFLTDGSEADYVNTGAWSTKAIKEARRVGQVNVAASSESTNFAEIPELSEWNTSASSVYTHITSNNTIHGTEFHWTPAVSSPLVCDASSNFLSRPIDMERYGLIYAGAQKNIGPAGVTVVLIHDDFLGGRTGDLPTLLDYGTHTAKLFHTPTVFGVYIIGKVLKWLQDGGGLDAMHERNRSKADVLYARIDKNAFYSGTTRTGDRSLMNVTFRLGDQALEPKFIAEAKDAGLVGLKGHRSVGGIRASIYNACEPSSVQALVSFMDHFESTNG